MPGPFPWPEALAPGRGGTLVRVRVNPHASREGIAGVVDGRLVLKVSAPPVDDRANHAALKLLAAALGVPPSRCEVLRGVHGRNKDILVRGWEPGAGALLHSAKDGDT